MLANAEKRFWQRQNIKRALQSQAAFLVQHNRVERAEDGSFIVLDKVFKVVQSGARLYCDCEVFRHYRTCAHVMAVQMLLRERREP